MLGRSPSAGYTRSAAEEQERILKFQNVKGTRDFYPEQMARRNWLIGQWREISRRSGFVEYDGSTGLSRRITASTDPKTFAQLQRRIAGRPPEQLAPHQDLTRHGQQQVMTDQISDSFVDMAFQIFRAGNDGRLPDLTSDVDRATVEAIVNGLAGQAKWNEP